MKAIQTHFIIVLGCLLSAHAAVSMKKEEDKKQLLDVPMMLGNPTQQAYIYGPITPEALRNNPVFKKIQQNADTLGVNLIEVIEETLTLPSQALRQKKEDDENYAQISDQISSVIINEDAKDNDDIIPVQEFFNSVKLEAQKAQETTAEIASTPATSGLSWTLLWNLKWYGEQATLQYMFDKNLFDPNNTDHIALLKPENAQYCIANYTATHKKIDAECKQKADDLKKQQCCVMTALLSKAQSQLSALTQELEKQVKQHDQVKEIAFKAHQEAYEKNNAQLQNILQQCTAKNITLKETTQHVLATSPELHQSIQSLAKLYSRTEKTLLQFNKANKVLENRLIPKLAIENNK